METILTGLSILGGIAFACIGYYLISGQYLMSKINEELQVDINGEPIGYKKK